MNRYDELLKNEAEFTFENEKLSVILFDYDIEREGILFKFGMILNDYIKEFEVFTSFDELLLYGDKQDDDE